MKAPIVNRVVALSCWRFTDTASSGPWTPFENFLAPLAVSSGSDVPRPLPLGPLRDGWGWRRTGLLAHLILHMTSLD